MADIVRPGDLPCWLARVAPLQSLVPLVGGELRLAAHLHATGLGELAALAGARADQLALELSQAAQHGEHQASVGCGGISPGIAQGPESGLAAGDGRQGVEKIAGRARQPVQPGHHQHVAGRQVIERAPELAAVGLGPAGDLPEHLLAAGPLELGDLCRHALAVCGYPGIAVNHAKTMHRTFATKKPNPGLDLAAVQNS